MSDYQDLCEMYGTDASDPDFLDWLIDGAGDSSREHKENQHFQCNTRLPSGRLVHMVKLVASNPAKPVAAKFNFKLPTEIGFSKANILSSPDLENPAGWFVERGFTVRSMKENGYWYQLAYKATNDLTILSKEMVENYCSFANLEPEPSDFIVDD